MNTDRNLLFGVLALQADLLDPPHFAEVCCAWAGRKEVPLAQLLIERGWITQEDRELIDRLLELKLRQHGGDPRATLASTAGVEVRQILNRVEDAEVQQSLSNWPESNTTPGPTTTHEPERRDRYALTHLHARGGIGQVWVARDTDLGRDVALKELRTDRAGQPEARKRFLKEAQITGQLEHPNIVPVYELARREGDDQPFYAMRLVRGRTLRETLRAVHEHGQGGDPLEQRRLLTAFASICQAVAFAHSKGVIHRDLKPHNVVLGDFGEVVLLDWGLAKLVGEPEDGELTPLALTEEAMTEATAAGRVLGTPAYMAPEQAAGKNAQLDARTDVYGLGAILFEILTGMPPFRGKDTAEVLRQVVNEETPRARAVNLSVPPALDAICARAMAKRPGDRYPSATDLADDVTRFLADQPVSAWPEPMSVRAARWARRHRPLVPAAAALLLTAVVTLSISTILILWQMAETDQARQQADINATAAQEQKEAAEASATKAKEQEAEAKRLAGIADENAATARQQEGEAKRQTGIAEERRQLAESRLEQARRGIYAAQLSQVALLADRDPAEGQAMLLDPVRCPPDLRDFTWRLLLAACKRDRFTVRVGPVPDEDRRAALPASVAFADESTLIAVARATDRLFVTRRDAQTGAELGSLVLPREAVFSRDMRAAAAFTPGHEVRLWNLVEGGEPSAHKLTGLDAPPAWYAFSPDLRTLLTAGKDRTLRVWDATTGALRHAVAGLQGLPVQAVFNAAGNTVVTLERLDIEGGEGQAMQVWDLAEGKKQHALPGQPHAVERVVLSPDGKRLAAWDRKPSAVTLFDLTSGQAIELPQAGLPYVNHLEFSADGRFLFGRGAHIGGGQAVSGDANVSADLKLWSVADGAPRLLRLGQLFDGFGVLSPDGKTLAAGHADGMQLWDVATGNLRTGLSVQLQKSLPVAFSPDSRLLVLKGGRADEQNEGLKLWDLAADREVLALPIDGPVVFSPTGQALAARVRPPRARLPRIEKIDNFMARALGMMEKALDPPVVTTDDNLFTVWDVGGEGRLGQRMAWGKPALSLAFAPDGGSVALIGGERGGFPLGRLGEAALFDRATGQVRVMLAQGGSIMQEVSGLGFSPDGRFLAIGQENVIQLWDSTGRVRTALALPKDVQGKEWRGGVLGLAWTSDSKSLAAVTPGWLKVWDVASREVLTTLPSQGIPFSCVAVSPDGAVLAVGCVDGTVQTFDRKTGAQRAKQRWHQKRVTAVAFDPTGRVLASAGDDRSAILWNVDENTRTVLRGHTGEVLAVAFSPDGRTLATGGADRTIRLWDPVTGQARATLLRHSFLVRCLAFAPDGEMLVSGGEGEKGGDLFGWRAAPVQRERITFAGHSAAVERLAFAPGGKALLTLSGDGMLKRFDVAAGQEVESVLSPFVPREGAWPPQPLSLRVGPDGKAVVTCAAPDARNQHIAAQRWREGDAKPEEVPGTAFRLLWSRAAETPDGGRGAYVLNPNRFYLSGSMAVQRLTELSKGREPSPPDQVGTTVLRARDWDARAGKVRLLGELPQHGLLQASRDGRLLAVSPDQTGVVRLVEAATGVVEREFQAHPGAVWQAWFSPDGERLITYGADRAVKLWDVTKGRNVATLIEKTDGSPPRVEFMSDGAVILASGSSTARAPLAVYETSTGKPRPLPDGLGRLSLVAVAPTGATVIVQPESKPEVQLWDLANEKKLSSVKIEGYAVGQSLVSPDAKFLLVPSSRSYLPGSVTVLDLATGKQLAELADGYDYDRLVRPRVEDRFARMLTMVSSRTFMPANAFFTPDGATLVLGRVDGAVQLFDAKTWKLRRTLWNHHSGNGVMALSPDGVRLASRTRYGVQLWDLGAEEEVGFLEVEGGKSDDALWFSADGRHVLFVGRDGAEPTGVVAFRTAEKPVIGQKHKGPIWAVAVTADGKLAATGGDDRVVRLWEPETGKEKAVLAGHDGPVWALAFGPPPQNRLASAAGDGTVRVWDAAGRRVEHTLQCPADRGTNLAFSEDGQLLACFAADLTVHVWEAATGKERAVLSGQRATVKDMAFSPDGKRLALAGADGTATLWDLASPPPGPALPAVVGAHRDRPQPVVFTVDGGAFFRGRPDGTVVKVDLGSGKEEVLPGRQDGAVLALALSPDGKLLASGGEGLLLRDAGTGAEKGPLGSHSGPVTCLAFSPDGAILASGTAWPSGLFSALRPGEVKLWDVVSRTERHSLHGHRGGVWGLSFSPDGKLLAGGSDDGTALLWDLQTGRVRFTYRHGRHVFAVAFSPDGKRLVSAGHGPDVGGGQAGGRMVRVWNPVTGEEHLTVAPTGERIHFLGFSPDGQTLAGAGDEGTVYLWEFPTRRDMVQLFGRPGQAQQVAFSPDGKRLAAVGADGTTDVWAPGGSAVRPLLRAPFGTSLSDAASDARGGLLALPAVTPGKGTEVLVVETATGRQRSAILVSPPAPVPPGGFANPVVALVALSPDGRRLAVTTPVYEGGKLTREAIRVWDTQSGKDLYTLEGLAGRTWALAFSADGGMLATAGDDKIVRLWDMTTGKEKSALKGHAEAVRALAFRPNGSVLASQSDDQVVKLWDVAQAREWGAVKAGEPAPVPREGVPLGGMSSLAFAPDGKSLATAAYRFPAGARGPGVKVWEIGDPAKDAPPGVEKTGLSGGAGPLSSVIWLDEGRALAGVSGVSYAERRPVRCWDVKTGRSWGTTLPLRQLVSGDGRALAVVTNTQQVGDWTANVAITDLKTGLPTWSTSGKVSGPPATLAVADKVLLTAGRQPANPDQPGELSIWDIDGAGDVTKKKARLTLQGTTGLVRAVALASDGKTAAAAGDAKTVWVFDATSGKQLHALAGHAGAVTAVSFSPDNKLLLSADDGGAVKVWDLTAGKELVGFQAHEKVINVAAFSPDGLTLATGGADRMVRLWEAKTGKEQATLRGHNDAVLTLAFSPDGKTVASAGLDRVVRLWDAGSGKSKAVLTGHRYAARAVAFAPDGLTLLSGDDESVRVWDAVKGRPVGNPLPGRDVRMVGFTPDGKGRWVLSTSALGVVRTGMVEAFEVPVGQIKAVYPAAAPKQEKAPE